jgi:hypothetical protein
MTEPEFVQKLLDGGFERPESGEPKALFMKNGVEVLVIGTRARVGGQWKPFAEALDDLDVILEIG